MSITIRTAIPDDAQLLVGLIHELAAYEKLSAVASPDPDALEKHLHPDSIPRCEAIIAESGAQAAGFALFFRNYSTFRTNWGIYLEDLFVRPEYRGIGVGFALLKHVARIAADRGCARMEWAVLDWNQLAIDFYRKLGAEALDDWTTMRLSGDALTEVGRPHQ